MIEELPDNSSGPRDKYGLENPKVIDFLRREFFQKGGTGKLCLYIANPWVDENNCMGKGCGVQAVW